MHSAPSVTYPVGRSRALACLMLALALLGAASIAYWAFLAGGFDERIMVGAASLAASTLWAASTWKTMAPGELCWDGQDWQWVSAGRAIRGELAVHLDAQDHLLLRIRPHQGAPRWCWAERRSAPARWADLRRAVYSRAKAVAQPRAAHESAIP